MNSLFRNILIFLALFISTQICHSAEEEGDTTASKIEFIQLEATLSSRIIHFRWSVEKESRGNHFIIEKSTDQEHWSKVTEVSSIKTHDQQHTYEISQIDFAEGVNEYFRVLRVDEFGQTTEMDRININRPVLTNMLLIPVPRKVHKEMTLSYDSMISAEGMLTVINRQGEIVDEFEVSISEGYNRFQLHIKNFEKGDYLVTVRDQYDNKISKRLIVHK